MKFENAAIVMTDTDTGKPYARPLSAWELNLVLSQLQALDGGALKAQEIAPFVLHSVGVSPQQAQRIAEKQAGLHYVARQGAQGLVDMANAHLAAASADPFEDKPRTVKGTGKIPGGLQQIAKGTPATSDKQKGSACPHETIIAGECIECAQRVRGRGR